MAAEVVLTTPRLTLRPHGVADFDDCAALWRDPAVVRFIGSGQPLTGEEVWQRLLRYAGCWRLFGFGYWAVRERDGGRFVGDVGFQRARRSAEPALPDEPELGWVLAPIVQGHGFAREAVAAALAWADRHLPDARTFCIIHPDHVRSIRVAAAAGYALSGATTLQGRPLAVFSRPRGFQSPVSDTTS